MLINKTKFWWGVVGLVVLVLVGVNVYLFFLRKSIFEFIEQEAELSNKRVEQIREFRH